MGRGADHERLDAWQKAMQALVMSYAIARRLPVEERYGLASQIRRAAVSIPANIAEGCGRSSQKERLHFFSIAQGSNAELRTLLSATAYLGYLSAPDLVPVREILEHVGQLISGLRRYIIRRRTSTTAHS